MYLATLDCRIGSECFTIISMSYKEMIVNMDVKRPLRIHLRGDQGGLAPTVLVERRHSKCDTKQTYIVEMLH